jgi:hypothetical protein
MNEPAGQGRLSDFLRDVEEFEKIDAAARERIDKIGAVAADPRARDPKKFDADLEDMCVDVFAALGEREEKTEAIATSFGPDRLGDLASSADLTRRLAELAVNIPSVGQAIKSMSRRLHEAGIPRLNTHAESISSLMDGLREQMQIIDVSVLAKRAREAIGDRGVLSQVARAVEPHSLSAMMQHLPAFTSNPIPDAIVREAQELGGWFSKTKPYRGLLEKTFGRQVMDWTVTVLKQLVEAGVFEGDPTDEEVIARTKAAIPGRLLADATVRRANARSFNDLVDALEGAGFTSCDGWLIDEFSKLAEAGVFDDAPDDAELRRRVARTLPQRVEDENVELDITQAAEVLNTTPRALHRRIQRARERDEPHPFEKRYEVGAGKLFVMKDALIAWSRTQRGRGRPRGS